LGKFFKSNLCVNQCFWQTKVLVSKGYLHDQTKNSMTCCAMFFFSENCLDIHHVHKFKYENED